jgi:hypothetical protein
MGCAPVFFVGKLVRQIGAGVRPKARGILHGIIVVDALALALGDVLMLNC